MFPTSFRKLNPHTRHRGMHRGNISLIRSQGSARVRSCSLFLYLPFAHIPVTKDKPIDEQLSTDGDTVRLSALVFPRSGATHPFPPSTRHTRPDPASLRPPPAQDTRRRRGRPARQSPHRGKTTPPRPLRRCWQTERGPLHRGVALEAEAAVAPLAQVAPVAGEEEGAPPAQVAPVATEARAVLEEG